MRIAESTLARPASTQADPWLPGTPDLPLGYSNRGLRQRDWAWDVGLAVVVAIGTALRATWVRREALWGDEIFSRDVALQSYSNALARVRADIVHPPLYNLLLDWNAHVFGASPLALRLPSIICGTLTIAVLAIALRQLLHRRDVPLVAAALLSISQLQIYYSQEIRSYALYEFLAILVIWTAVGATIRRTDVRWWSAFAGTAAATVLTHNVGVFFIGATVVAPLVAATNTARRALVTRWILAVLPAAVLSIAWTAYVVPAMRARRGLGGNLDWIAHPGLLDWTTLFASFAGIPHIPHAISLMAAVGIALAGVAAYVTFRPVRDVSEQELAAAPIITAESTPRARITVATLLCCALLPPAVLFAISNSPLGISFWGERHLLPAAACWSSLLAIGVCALIHRSRVAGLLAGAVIVAPNLAAVRDMARTPLRIPYDVVASVLSRSQNRGVPAFTTAAWNIGAPTNYYISGRDSVQSLPPVLGPDLAPDFWLAYRADQMAETARVSQIKAAGWRTADSVSIERGPGTRGGVTLIRVVRSDTSGPLRLQN